MSNLIERCLAYCEGGKCMSGDTCAPMMHDEPCYSEIADALTAAQERAEKAEALSRSWEARATAAEQNAINLSARATAAEAERIEYRQQAFQAMRETSIARARATAAEAENVRLRGAVPVLIARIREELSRDSQVLFYSITGRQRLNNIMNEALSGSPSAGAELIAAALRLFKAGEACDLVPVLMPGDPIDLEFEAAGEAFATAARAYRGEG